MADLKNDHEAIKTAIIKFYHEGHVKSDPELYKEIIHDDWKFFYFDKDKKLNIVEKEEYLSWYEPQNADPELNWETEFYYVDVTGNVGAAKIRLECENVCYIDYFNLVKINSTWWIVNKLSHGVDK